MKGKRGERLQGIMGGKRTWRREVKAGKRRGWNLKDKPWRR